MSEPARPAPETQELLLDHVVPILRMTGVLPHHEQVRIDPPGGGLRSSEPVTEGVVVVPGRVRTSGVRTAEPPDPAQVHVHIDRVEVVHPAPAARVSCPPRRVTAGVDLDAYLARRRKDHG